MKLTIERNHLLAAMSRANAIADPKSTMPIYGNALLDAQGGTLTVSASSGDADVSIILPATVVHPGATTVPAAKLYDLASKLPEGSVVEIDADSAQATVRSGRSRVKLGCMSADQWPSTIGTDGTSFEIDGADLRALLELHKFGLTEETRYYLAGVHLAIVGDKIQGQGTNGHLLARTTRPAPVGSIGMPGVIIPTAACVNMVKLLKDAVTATLTVEFNSISLSVDTVRYSSKLIDGTFPDCDRVIPVGNSNVAESKVAELQSALSRVCVISDDKSKAVKMVFGTNNVELSSGGQGSDSSEESVEIKYAGPAMTIGFNSRYLLSVFGYLNGDSVRLEMDDSAGPTIIRAVGDESTIVIAMPMRT